MLQHLAMDEDKISEVSEQIGRTRRRSLLSALAFRKSHDGAR